MGGSDLTGRMLGHYRIESRLGAGGMGEVYRAYDAKLDRPVAIKLLTPAFSADPEWIHRFRAEARAASALNHPHILVIHDVGEADGRAFIVSELVEGRTLRDRIEDRSIGVREAIDIATQVASALAAAHARGIVHRDIKPENIMVRDDGYAKVLDFGLAKHTIVDESPDQPTLHSRSGVLMGTPAYMSPEQAAGRSLDFRSDQFSFGAVMYEIVTGRRPFDRPTAVQTAAAIITDEPEPLARVCPDLPPPFRWAIDRCLAKRPADRYGSTADLHRDLSTIHGRISEARAPATALPASNLPATPTSFVGRDEETAAVRAMLERPDVRWLTLTGPGGVGKTRLTVQVARDAGPLFHGATYFVPLAGVNDPRLVMSAVAQTLDIRAAAGESDLVALTRHFRSMTSPFLIVFDNFEHVAAAAVEVAEFLDACDTLKVLASSRARLNLSAEHEYQVSPLSVPATRGSVRAAAVATSPAVALFVERARVARPAFTLTDENAHAVVEICQAVDGLPLAIELAAARIKVLSPEALLSRLSSKRLSLDGGARDLPTRQQTLRATIEWGYELLTAAEQRLFRRLAVFAGGWTLESAEAVCDAGQDLGLDVFDGIASLVDKSLVRSTDADSAEPRFTMLATLREYALERLEAAGEGAATRRAHAAYALVLAEEGGDGDAATQWKWLTACDAEHRNLRAAIDHLIETRSHEWALRLACALVPFWQTRAHLNEARDVLQRVIRLSDDAALAPLRARAIFMLGTVFYTMGEFAAAADLHEKRALPLYRQLGDQHGVAAALGGIGLVMSSAGNFARARRAFEEGLSIWRGMGQEAAVARTLVNLAALEFEEGHTAAAIARYREARLYSEACGDGDGAAWALDMEGQVEFATGNLAAAATLLEGALARFRTVGDSWGVADALRDLAEIAAAAGDRGRSRQLLDRALDESRRAADSRGTIRELETRARIAARERQADRALRLAGAASAFRRSHNVPLPRMQRQALEHLLDEARQHIDPDLASRAWMEGWSWSPDEALAYARMAND